MKLTSLLKLLLLCLASLQQLQSSYGARILATFIFPTKSHFMMTHSIIRELIQRGHEVTFVTPFGMTKENLGKNYTEILIPAYDFWTEVKQISKIDNIFDAPDTYTIITFFLTRWMGVKSTEFALEQPGVQALINEKHKIGKYDLLLTEQFFNEPALMFGKLYDIPVICVSTLGYTNYMSQMVGIISPWSYVPHHYKPFTDRLTFAERISNTFLSAFDDLFRKFVYKPAQNVVLRKYFSHLTEEVVPTVEQLERNITMFLINSYTPLITARPTSFNIIPVGGLHIVPPKALPTHLQKFLDGAKHGAIYFSLGTQVRSADMPAEKLQIFLDVFQQLKLRVLWKFEDKKLPNLPKNVMVQAWMPQNDILAHPNVKVFITHGGLFGTQEAVHYGVPMLGMPVYSDQHLNVNQAKEAGYALCLNHRNLTVESLKTSLLDLIKNSKYKSNILSASRIFRDRPLSAMDTAMYWIDYVIEHRGAPHMIAAGVDLPWYQFYLLDIVALGLALLLLPMLLVYCCLRIQNWAHLQKKTKVKKN